jgi:hypothetical protein
MEKSGGCSRTRTCDPLIKSQLLYQLSYAPFSFVFSALIAILRSLFRLWLECRLAQLAGQMPDVARLAEPERTGYREIGAPSPLRGRDLSSAHKSIG